LYEVDKDLINKGKEMILSDGTIGRVDENGQFIKTEDETIVFESLDEFAITFLMLERFRDKDKYNKLNGWEKDAIHNGYKSELRAIAYMEQHILPYMERWILPEQLELDL